MKPLDIYEQKTINFINYKKQLLRTYWLFLKLKTINLLRYNRSLWSLQKNL